MSVAITLWVVLVIEVAAVLCVAYLALSGLLEGVRFLSKVGILLATFGLVIQVVRTLYFSKHGVYPPDVIVPLWATKDLGISLLIFDLTLAVFGKLVPVERS